MTKFARLFLATLLITSLSNFKSQAMKKLSEYFPHKKEIIQENPSGKYLAVASDNLIVYERNGYILTQKYVTALKAKACSISWSPDGKYLTIGFGNNLIIYEWNGSILIQKETNNKSKIEQKYELVLNEIYEALKNELNHESFLKLQKDQHIWIKNGKGIHLHSRGRERGFYKSLSTIENGYALRINELFKKYMPFIKSGLLKKLKNIKNDLPDGIKYAISWLIIYDSYEIDKQDEQDPDVLKVLNEEQAGYSLHLGKNLTAILIAPNLWLWAGRFIDYFCINNRHGGVMSFRLIDLNSNTISCLKIACPQEFEELKYYDGETIIEATCVSNFDKNCLCIDVIDYRNKKIPEEKIWLSLDIEKKLMVITKHEKYEQYKE